MRPGVILITGWRFWSNALLIRKALSEYPRGTIMIHGDCRGADSIAADEALKRSFCVWALPYFEADGQEARNASMVAVGVALQKAGHAVTVLAFPPETLSSGTRKCMRIARNAGLTVRDFATSAKP